MPLLRKTFLEYRVTAELSPILSIRHDCDIYPAETFCRSAAAARIGMTAPVLEVVQ
jgi:hypothetical protein